MCKSLVSLQSSNCISFHYTNLAAPAQTSPVGNMRLPNISFPLICLLPSHCKGHQLMIWVPGLKPLAVGISIWQHTLLPVGTGLSPKQNCDVGSSALRGPHTCFLSPPLCEFLHNLAVGKGLSNFDTKPQSHKRKC